MSKNSWILTGVHIPSYGWVGVGHGVRIQFLQLGKPAQNRFVERFNRTYREDVLDAYIFYSLDDVRKITFEWLQDYNSIRPHASLGNKTPYEFSAKIDSVSIRVALIEDIS